MSPCREFSYASLPAMEPWQLLWYGFQPLPIPPPLQTLLCSLTPPFLPCPSSGHHVVIVTSGAVGVGCHRLGLSAKPSQLAKKQALAAVGQVRGGRGRRGGLR